MADNISNQRAHVIEHVQLFINETIPLLQEHIDEGVHTVVHLQDIINYLIAINQDTANPQDWLLDQLSSSDSGGPASSSTGPESSSTARTDG